MSEPARCNGFHIREAFAILAAVFALTIAIGQTVTMADRPRRVVERWKEIELVMRSGLPADQQEAAVATILSRTETSR